MGLEWKHVDFDNSTIPIEQASQYIPGKGISPKTPKNKASMKGLPYQTSIRMWIVDKIKTAAK